MSKSTLRINGSVVAAQPKAGSLVISYSDALNAILAAEGWPGGGTERDHSHSEMVWEELPAIASHWLQTPDEPPILLDEATGKKWEAVLRSRCLLERQNPASGVGRELKHPKPIHIDFSDLPFPPLRKPKFTFMDLFAGIGGFRIALQNLGGKCVFSSEWDRYAKETYLQNYGEVPFGDITKLSSMKLVNGGLDVLAGGFPCQPFSRAGVSARNSLGQEHGFECETQGQLFFDVVNLAKVHRPRVLLLENVGNLIRHDGGNTFKVIRHTIENDLGYSFYHRVYNSNPLVPQSRVRCLIVAFREKRSAFWEMPELSGVSLPLRSILEDLPTDTSYTLSEKMWNGHIRRSARNVARGAGFTAYTRDLDKPSTTLVARYYKDGKECLIPQDDHPKSLPRMLTERECARLQGFPEKFRPHPSKVRAYKQFGNSVPVPLIEWLYNKIPKDYA